MRILPSPKKLKELLPLSFDESSFIFSAREKAQKIVQHKDSSLTFVMGPCSIHDLKSALSFAEHIKELQKEYPQFFFVMRTFVEKARSILGWKGLLYDPDLDGSHRLEKGLLETRSLFLELARENVPTACEFVDPFLSGYFSDLVTWGFIGARTSASQVHRQFASSLSYPVGFKNAVDGNLDVAIQGALSSSHPHTHVQINEEGRLAQVSSLGNPCTHIVLRGSLEQTNFDPHSVNTAITKLHEYNIRPRLLIDCSHGNSSRSAWKQRESFTSVLDQIASGNDHIMGMMIESFLQTGKQEKPLTYGVSITDECLGIEETKELIKEAARTPTFSCSI